MHKIIHTDGRRITEKEIGNDHPPSDGNLMTVSQCERCGLSIDTKFSHKTKHDNILCLKCASEIDKARGDACLANAAPALLDACKFLLSSLPHHEHDDNLTEPIIRARQAIAMAEGRKA